MVQGCVTRICVRIAHVIEVAFCYDPKRPNGGEHPTVLAIQLIQVLPLVLDQLSFEAVRQVQPVHERVTRIAIAGIQLSLTLVTLAHVLAPARVVDSLAIAVTCVEHGLSSRLAFAGGTS